MFRRTSTRLRAALAFFSLFLVASCSSSRLTVTTGRVPKAGAPQVLSPGDTALAVTLLETTDFHGALLSGGTERSTGRPWGGGAVMSTWQQALRARNPERTFLLDGGDMMQGTPISNMVRGRSVIEYMNALRYDAAALGNHEFDWGIDTLRARVAQATFPVLAANVFEKASGMRPSWVQPYTIVRRGKVAVGVVGAATPETPRVTIPTHVASLRFDDPIPILQSMVAEVRSKGADVVVVLAHIGGDVREGQARGQIMDIAREVAGVDVVFGGHTHTFVSTTVGAVPVLIAGSNSRGLAAVDLIVNPHTHRARVVGHTLHRTYADSVSVAPNDPIARIVSRYNAEVAPIMNRVVGIARDVLRRDGPAMGNFVTDVMRAATGADVAITNSGGLRADLDAGGITLGEIFEVLPFDNTIVTVRLSGAEIKMAIEENPSRALFSGLRARYDTSRPLGDRLIGMEDAAGRAISPADTLTVVTNDFMAQGGDGFTVFEGRWSPTGLLVRDAAVAAVEKLTAAGRELVPDSTDRMPGRPGRDAR
jgi:2',3'-cyclic-nucleotide 2'-phosphodiesterase/3'-nucleotidase